MTQLNLLLSDAIEIDLTQFQFQLFCGIFAAELIKQVKEESKRTWKTRNLCFAKYRHSSTLKPVSRFILHPSPLIHAAMELLVSDKMKLQMTN